MKASREEPSKPATTSTIEYGIAYILLLETQKTESYKSAGMSSALQLEKPVIFAPLLLVLTLSRIIDLYDGN
jgi:hypothetical protein